MFRIEGLDALTRQLKEVEAALSNLDGELGTVRFDADDPVDVERAIRDTERLVDNRVSRFRGNDVVYQIVRDFKAAIRKDLLEKAAAARQQKGQNS